jgi:hypothetical protein
MDIVLITPFIPLILRGRLRENCYLNGDEETLDFCEGACQKN